jgi:hypothetical protein
MSKFIGVFGLICVMTVLFPVPASAENYLLRQDSAPYQAGDLLQVKSCAGSKCTLQNTLDKIAKSKIKKARTLRGSIFVQKWGWLTKSIYRAAKANCGGGDPAECLCEDGPVIGACGD